MKRKENMPELVFIGLMGINSKTAAYSYFGIAVALAIFSIFAGMKNPVYFYGVGFLLAALWYFYCIKWVDNNSSWDD